LLANEESSHHDKDSRAIQGQGTVRRK
jgi:hypothetical protein